MRIFMDLYSVREIKREQMHYFVYLLPFEGFYILTLLINFMYTIYTFIIGAPQMFFLKSYICAEIPIPSTVSLVF